MSMFNPDFEGGTPGQHHVGPPVRGSSRETPGVAKPYTGAPGETRGTDETMGTGVGGTLTNVGIPAQPNPTTTTDTTTTTPTAAAFPEPSATTKVMAGVKELGSDAVESVTEAIDKINQAIK